MEAGEMSLELAFLVDTEAVSAYKERVFIFGLELENFLTWLQLFLQL